MVEKKGVMDDTHTYDAKYPTLMKEKGLRNNIFKVCFEFCL